MSYASTLGNDKDGFKGCIVINDGISRCFILERVFRKEADALKIAQDVHKLLEQEIKYFLDIWHFREG